MSQMTLQERVVLMKTKAKVKAQAAGDCGALEHIPNIGPALARDLRLIGVEHPAALKGQDAFQLYRKLCTAKGKRQDPCVLDTFIAAVDFMEGAAPAPWWKYTKARKATHGDV
ncbi:hypothetical protein BH09PSE5_BH09PSE5_31130 [soil metagenome]